MVNTSFLIDYIFYFSNDKFGFNILNISLDKIGASVVGGYNFIDTFSYDAYNECEDLEKQVKLYFERFGYYPDSVNGDKIYLNKKNREYLKSLNIKIIGKPLGRPSKEMQTPEYKAKAAKEMGERNEVEGMFGTGKRIFRANNIRAKLPNTTDLWVAMCFLAKNAMKFLKELFPSFFLHSILSFFYRQICEIYKYWILEEKEIKCKISA